MLLAAPEVQFTREIGWDSTAQRKMSERTDGSLIPSLPAAPLVLALDAELRPLLASHSSATTTWADFAEILRHARGRSRVLETAVRARPSQGPTQARRGGAQLAAGVPSASCNVKVSGATWQQELQWFRTKKPRNLDISRLPASSSSCHLYEWIFAWARDHAISSLSLGHRGHWGHLSSEIPSCLRRLATFSGVAGSCQGRNPESSAAGQWLCLRPASRLWLRRGVQGSA